MNPYLIIGALLALAAAAGGGFYEGHKTGIDGQKVADQAQFDAINAGLTKQKADAAALLAQANADNAALAVARDTLKTTLETEREKNRAATDSLHTQLAGVGLRFRAQGAGCGASGGGTQAAGTDPAAAQSSAVVQLPDALAASLRQLAYDADKLRDDYALCYGYATQVR